MLISVVYIVMFALAISGFNKLKLRGKNISRLQNLQTFQIHSNTLITSNYQKLASICKLSFVTAVFLRFFTKLVRFVVSCHFYSKLRIIFELNSLVTLYSALLSSWIEKTPLSSTGLKQFPLNTPHFFRGLLDPVDFKLL